jgi:transposase
VDGLDLSLIEQSYPSKGAPPYHPRLLLKVIIYGYLCNTYSSRKLEDCVKHDVRFMWLTGLERPDHNTINRFRSTRLKDTLKSVFQQVVELLVEAGLVSLKKVYVDGTKIEANANRYTFVWGKSVARYKNKIKEELEELWAYTEQVAASELEAGTPPICKGEINQEKVKQTITQINEALQDKDLPKGMKKKLKKANKDFVERMGKYDVQEGILCGRNSYSKTDPDATFMRMKEDHMKNGQLKPAYNLQISTEEQFITNYDLYPNPTDTRTLQDHMDGFNELHGHYPEEAIADAGYGSEENYEYLESKGVEAYIKYYTFHQEQKNKGKAPKKHPFISSYLYYNSEEDFIVCPMGQRMENYGTKQVKNKSGYLQTYSIYKAKNCQGCPLRGSCHKAKGNRVININHRLENYKQKARDRLTSEKGIAHRKQRPADVEAVFGNIKWNKGFKRFLLRGKKKVEIEIGLVSLAHNIAKMSKMTSKVA